MLLFFLYTIQQMCKIIITYLDRRVKKKTPIYSNCIVSRVLKNDGFNRIFLIICHDFGIIYYYFIGIIC